MNVTIDIRSTTMAFAEYFKKLNEAWISTYFWLEEQDIPILNDPQSYILDKGGNVFIAIQDSKPVGTCALLVRDGLTCELTKLAVDPQEQGKGIGYMLASAMIQTAKERGFTRVVLEGNTKMDRSISLYRKLGFRETQAEYDIHGISNHRRCNIFMELFLVPTVEPEYFI